MRANSRGTKSARSSCRERLRPVRSGSVATRCSSAAGASVADPVVLTPMPKIARPPPAISTRMPASLRPDTSTSLGQWTPAATPGTSCRIDSAKATPAASDQVAGGLRVVNREASTTRLTARLPGGCHQPAPRRPRPRVWRSATTASGSTAVASAASCRATSIVEGISCRCSTRARRPGPTRRAGSKGSGGGGAAGLGKLEALRVNGFGILASLLKTAPKQSCSARDKPHGPAMESRKWAPVCETGQCGLRGQWSLERHSPIGRLWAGSTREPRSGKSRAQRDRGDGLFGQARV